MRRDKKGKKRSTAWLGPIVLGCLIVAATQVRNKESLMKGTSVEKDALVVPNQADFEYCKATNKVLSRGDKFGNNNNSANETRPFSLNVMDYAPYHPQQSSLPKCSSAQQVQDALQWGHREWDNKEHNKLPSLEKEQVGSHFVPFGCRIEAFTPDQICNVLNQYSQVVLMGDSLLRHIHQAIYISLSNDYAVGGVISSQKGGPYDLCRCDGQFSEHRACRQGENEKYFGNLTNPMKEGYCTHLSSNTPPPFQLLNQPHWKQLEAADRPMLLVLNGGSHQKSNADWYHWEKLLPIFNDPGFQKCNALGKVHVVHIHFGSQSRSLDQKYPHQAREKALLFNAQMKQMLQEKHGDVPYHALNWWNLTQDAQTSDGFHFLMDVNVIMAQFIFNLAQQLAVT